MWSFPDNPGRAAERKATRFLYLIGNVIAVLIAVFPPAVYFFYSQSSLRAHLQAEADTGAARLTDFINRTQDLWKYDEIRLRGILSSDRPEQQDEISRVRDREGTIVLEVGKSLGDPVITASHEVMDAGRAVGTYERVQSLRPILRRTGWVAAIGGLLGLAGLLFFKSVPLRSLLEALQTLSEERDRAQVTLLSIGDAVLVTDTKGDVVSLNRVAEELTGWTEADARGRPLSEIFFVQKLEAEQGEKPQQGGTGARIVLDRDLMVSRAGAKHIVEGTITPIIDSLGVHKGSVVVCRDITGKAREEEELFKARKLESIGLLAGGIAHDFNNILMGILGNLSLAKMVAGPDSKILDRIKEAEKASSRAKELASKLLAFSKGGKPIRKLLKASDLLEEPAQLAVRGTASRVTVRLPEDLWMVEADPVHMDQVISNLVINATHAMPGGGTIHVEAENAVVGEGDIPHVRGGDYLKIRIRDQGTGIPKELVGKIFDPYFTTKESGSGLGLTTCYTIMKNHKGNIFVESEEGAGSTFILFLPAVRRTAGSDKEVPGEVSQPGSGRILFMDDEEMVRDVAGNMLVHLGYEPVFAKNGEEAIDLYRRMISNGNSADLVIMDITVPGGMGGIEASRRIREIDPGAKILISSGYANNEAMAQYREHGFDGCIAKPYKIEELSRAIRASILDAPA